MKRNKSQFDKVERYLRGSVSAEEAKAMEKTLAENPEFAEELTFQQLELDAMELIVEQKLRSKMESWKKDPAPQQQKDKKAFWLFICVAVTVILAILLLWFWLNKPSPKTDPNNTHKPGDTTQRDPNPIANQDKKAIPILYPSHSGTEVKGIKIPETDKIAANLATNAYSLPEDLKAVLKSPGEAFESPLDPGMKAFFDKDYATAIEELSKIKPSDGEDLSLRAQEVLAHSYFLTQQYPQAAKLFSVLAEKYPNQDFEWYRILALLPQYSRNKAQIDALLDPILNPTNYHDYQLQAEVLQGKLLQLQNSTKK